MPRVARGGATRTTRASLYTPTAKTRAKNMMEPAPLGSSPLVPIHLDEDDEPAPSKKRKTTNAQASQHLTTPSKKKPAHQKSSPSAPSPEKRLRRFRPAPPQSFYEVYERALTQRFFVLQRTRTGTEECPGEEVELTGSTGNIYKVTIGLKPVCNCPHGEKGNQCKHLLFVMKKVLNAPDNLVYQLALLSTELRDIFAAAPPIPTPGADGGKDSDKRKPIEGDCPICFSELGDERESIVWCRAACGQNMHQECFETWAKTKTGDVTCPMCRSVWEGDPNMVSRVEKSRGSTSEGYVNVASQLGISTVRDTSSYSDWYWRRGRSGWGGGYGGRRRGGWGRW